MASAIKPPVSVCRPSAPRTLTANVWQQIIFDDRKYDPANGCDITGSTKFKPSKAGYYRVSANYAYTKTAGSG